MIAHMFLFWGINFMKIIMTIACLIPSRIGSPELWRFVQAENPSNYNYIFEFQVYV